MGKVGSVRKLQPGKFPDDEGWQRVTEPQVMRSLMKILKVDDAGYRIFYVRTKKGLSTGETSSLLEMWAGWTPQPAAGDLLVCVYSDESQSPSSSSS